MSNVPDQLRYRDSHEWVDPTQAISPVGISDHAQAELTDVVFVELPKLGPVTAGQQVCVIESVKAAIRRYRHVDMQFHTFLSEFPLLLHLLVCNI